MNRFGDLASKAHAFTGPGMPELRATRFPAAPPLQLDESHGSAAYAHRRSHDYAYGLSKAHLRPVVLDENYGDTRIPTPKPRKRRKQRATADIVRRIQPVLYDNMPIEVDMPPDDEPDLSVPWWLDEDVLVSRNEDMLSDLLAESQ